MKKSFLLFFMFGLFIFNNNANAQKAYRLVSPDLLPQTTVNVTVVIEKEITHPGPYARFAQKYIGIMAPLSEKEIFSIKKAYIDYFDPDKTERTISSLSRINNKTEHMSHVKNDSGFTKVRIDRMSSSEKSLEEMARDAANMIFKLRRQRVELITGEAGEHVFGGGLKAAIDEITRMENEYLALFLGKQTKITETIDFDIIPEAGKNNYIVFRFSNTTGALPATDLSAEPVVLTLQSENTIQDYSKSKGALFMIAEYAQASLINGPTELAQKRIPVYQFGKVVQLPLAK